MSTAVSSRLTASPVLRSLPRLPRPWVSEPAPVDSGLLALLVTDIEGFTPLVERLGDEPARELIHTHNALVRDAIEQHRGDELAHTGDGIMASFRSIVGALRAAIAIQDALGAHSRAHREVPLHARIGVHAGEPLPEEGRLFGLCLNATVRVCGAAEADHVLVSDLACQLASGRGFRFADRGPVALKGLREPMRLHELLLAGHSTEK